MPVPDGHVHTEWSWDTTRGSMERTCARAVTLGLPSVAFTEHADFTPWTVDDPATVAHLPLETGPDGTVRPRRLDVDGYLTCLGRCRDLFPELRILSGVEMGEPHLNAAELAGLGTFDRVLGSLHVLPLGDGTFLPVEAEAYARMPADDLVRRYLAEAAHMVRTCDTFEVLAHVDFPIRSWPGRYDASVFEAEFREVLRALADSGRALEVNTRLPLDPLVVGWWRDVGGDALTFGSDAHEPEALARGFPAAEAMAEAAGFRPGRRPHDLWTRT